MAKSDEQKIMQWLVIIVLGIIGIVVLLIALFFIAFQIFKLLTVVSAVILVISFVHDIIIWFRGDYMSEYWSIFPLIAFIGCFTLSVIFFSLYFGLATSSIGQFSLDVASAYFGFQAELSAAQEQAINQVVTTSCQTLPAESCNKLKMYVTFARTIEEVQGYADNLKTAAKIAKKAQNAVS